MIEYFSLTKYHYAFDIMHVISFSKFSCNSEVEASELPENVEERFLHYLYYLVTMNISLYRHIDIN